VKARVGVRGTRRRFRRDPTEALFADQSQSILDNLVALLRRKPSMELLGWGTAAAVSGISRHSSEGNDALVGWCLLSATAEHDSMVPSVPQGCGHPLIRADGVLVLLSIFVNVCSALQRL
jgi:hypothetical protein